MKKKLAKISQKVTPPRWLAEQQAKRWQFLVFVGRCLLAIVFVAVLGFSTLALLRKIYKSPWDSRYNFNFVILVGKELVVVSYHPNQIVNILLLPQNTYLDLAKGFGEYPASSIWSLGQLEKIGGGELLQLSVQHFLGVPIQGWGRVEKLKIKNEKLKINKRELLELIARLAFTKERNLTLWDLGRLLYKLVALPPSQIKFYSLDQTRAGEEVILPDGSKAFHIQKEFLDALSRDLFKDTVFLEEGIIWAALNTTTHPGLAGQVARIINNIGGGVIIVSDVGARSVKGGIYCWEKKICQSYSARLLGKTFKLRLREEKFEESRAEAVVVLDEDYWQFFYRR